MTIIALSVTIDGIEVFRVGSAGRDGVMPADSNRASVLRALANGLGMLLGTDLSDDPLEAAITVRRSAPATIVRLER
jgi:hypothetical protein